MTRADGFVKTTEVRQARRVRPSAPSTRLSAGTRRQMMALSWGLLAFVVAILVSLAAPPPATAAATQFRLSGDLHVAADQTLDSAVTLNGDIRGRRGAEQRVHRQR